MIFTSFAILPYIVASVSYFILGALWYSLFFRNPWMIEVDAKQNGDTSNMPLLMIGQLISSFLYALGVYAVIQFGNYYSFTGALIAASIVSVFFVLSINSGKALFQGKPILFAIDAGYNVAGAFIIAFILAFWK